MVVMMLFLKSFLLYTVFSLLILKLTSGANVVCSKKNSDGTCDVVIYQGYTFKATDMHAQDGTQCWVIADDNCCATFSAHSSIKPAKGSPVSTNTPVEECIRQYNEKKEKSKVNNSKTTTKSSNTTSTTKSKAKESEPTSSLNDSGSVEPEEENNKPENKESIEMEFKSDENEQIQGNVTQLNTPTINGCQYKLNAMPNCQLPEDMIELFQSSIQDTGFVDGPDHYLASNNVMDCGKTFIDQSNVEYLVISYFPELIPNEYCTINDPPPLTSTLRQINFVANNYKHTVYFTFTITIITTTLLLM